MMQISSIPAHSLNLFQAKNASFKCRGSPLNPLTRLPSANSRIVKSAMATESTRKHLSNLEKLLQKQAQPNPLGQPENKGKGGIGGPELGQDLARDEGSGGDVAATTAPATGPDSSTLSTRISGGRWSGTASLSRPLTIASTPTLRCQRTRLRLPATWRCRIGLTKVTKSLYATSSVGLPTWVDEVAPDLGWMTQRTSCIGYVAVCDDHREIARMGRRDIVIALRGTATCLEWAENMRDLLVQMPSSNDSTHRQPKVECGFLSLYKTRGTHVPSLAESVVEEIRRLMDQYKGETLSITVTGHSLGAALALLVADELSTCASDVPPVAVFSFGGPRVGMFVSEGLDRTLRNSSAAAVLDVLDNNMPWAYSHVGTELRVDTKMSPYLKPNADVACCHDLEAYLHLVDGFLSSNCPFRANAKRSLAKLLHEQNSNVKKLYTSKVKALSLNLDQREGILNMASCLPSPSN
ncbi:alpha/beta-Hydrolases superfamily protein [Actinidia rufa]|uniref:Alpha/beta-Hydrolases superfamily protein n=1 Tax=Actinidia rufa TaxID=165716 RepID=A0A7J0H0D3_9ERIC|nr:alpha/beta-Hydrolases superfamily protein [Actinidia rufa]